MRTSTFDKAIEKFQNSLTAEQKSAFAVTTVDDVETEIQKIQIRYGSEKRLRGLKRLSKFIAAMKQIEELVKVFLNVHEVVAFVWGPIKLLLMIAGAGLDSLECLLETFDEIGEVIPGLKQYDVIFEHYPLVREVLERYFMDILNFQKLALDIFARPNWQKIWKSSWKTFETSLKPILESLRRHRTLLENEKLTAAIQEVQKSRQLADHRFDTQSEQTSVYFNKLLDTINTIFQELSKQIYESQTNLIKSVKITNDEDLLKKRKLIAAKLRPPSYKSDQLKAYEQRFPSSGDWILGEKLLAEWISFSNDKGRILYRHGIPGAGKTTIVSRIIKHVEDTIGGQQACILYFYFKNDEAEKNSMNGMLRGILDQITRQDDNLALLVYEKCCSLSSRESLPIEMLKEVTLECLKSLRRCYIILDGLDECKNSQTGGSEEAKNIINWIQHNVVPSCQSEGACFRVMFSGQRDGTIEQLLLRCPNIKLDDMSAHLCDIREYTSKRVSQLRSLFSLAEINWSELVDKTCNTSHAMFLYAKVVLDNLADQCSDAEIEDEINNFPNGLDAAYERIAVRVFNRSSRSKRESAQKILGWIISSARPLKWREIQTMFCVDVEIASCNLKNRRVYSCKELCSSFIELESCEFAREVAEESLIRLVHSSAGQYLVQTGRLELLEEHARMSIFFFKYLSSLPFNQDASRDQIKQFALSGYYGCLDYAAKHCLHHFRMARLKVDADTDTVIKLKETMEVFINMYRPNQEKETLDTNQSFSPPQYVQDNIESWQINSAGSLLEIRVTNIRNIIEQLIFDEATGDDKSAFNMLYGVPRFKCPKILCDWFEIGFGTSKERKPHIDQHERPYKCSYMDCHIGYIGYSSISKLQDHIKRYHAITDDATPLFQRSGLKRGKELDIFDACKSGDLERVKYLISNGTSVNSPQQPTGKIRPLYIATVNRHIALCRYLIECGAELAPNRISVVPRETERDKNPLYEAIRRSDFEIFMILVDSAMKHGSDIFGFRERDIGLAVDVALHFESADILREILSMCSDENLLYRSLYNHIGKFEVGMEGEEFKNCLRLLNTKEINQLGSGKTLLHRAAESHIRHGVKASSLSIIISSLLECGADANIESDDGSPPVFYLFMPTSLDLEEFDLSSFKVFLEHTKRIGYKNKNGQSLLDLIAGLNEPSVQEKALLLLLEKDRLLSNYTQSDKEDFLIDLLRKKRKTAANVLLSSDLAFSIEGPFGSPALSLAAKCVHTEAMEWFLKRIDIGINDRSPDGLSFLLCAAIWGELEVIRLLLRYEELDVNIEDYNKNTPLLTATEIGGEQIEQIVRLLLTRDEVNVNAKNNYGRTPLLNAISCANVKIVEMLLTSDEIDVNLSDDDGTTPLNSACLWGYLAIVNMLLMRPDIDTNRADRRGLTPLFIAVFMQDKGLFASVLSNKDCIPDGTDRKGRSALSLAAETGYIDGIHLLINDARTSLNIVDRDNKTPLDRAVESGHEDIAELLRERGANRSSEISLGANFNVDFETGGFVGPRYSEGFNNDAFLQANEDNSFGKGGSSSLGLESGFNFRDSNDTGAGNL